MSSLLSTTSKTRQRVSETTAACPQSLRFQMSVEFELAGLGGGWGQHEASNGSIKTTAPTTIKLSTSSPHYTPTTDAPMMTIKPATPAPKRTASNGVARR